MLVQGAADGNRSGLSLPASALVVYGATDRADSVLRSLTRGEPGAGPRVTVVALAAQEPESGPCCDTRSVLWNDVCRSLAREDLDRARKAIGGDPSVELDVLEVPAGRAADVVAEEAARRGAEAIVLADPRACGLTRRDRRRLRRRSRVPVSESVT